MQWRVARKIATATNSIQQINEAFERVSKADVKYRFVIDMTSLNKR